MLKRLIEFILMNLFIFLIIFGAYTRSDTGILYQFGDDWYIDSSYRHNHSYSRSYKGIGNPDSFPHVLIPENNNSEVHFSWDTYPAIFGPFRLPVFIKLNSLEILPDFILKQSILYFVIAVSCVAVVTYIILNRERFAITDKLLR